jgi:hypothetical protein
LPALSPVVVGEPAEGVAAAVVGLLLGGAGEVLVVVGAALVGGCVVGDCEGAAGAEDVEGCGVGVTEGWASGYAPSL